LFSLVSTFKFSWNFLQIPYHCVYFCVNYVLIVTSQRRVVPLLAFAHTEGKTHIISQRTYYVLHLDNSSHLPKISLSVKIIYIGLSLSKTSSLFLHFF